MSGESTHALRGDYRHMRTDYTVDQDYAAYTNDQQALWRYLYNRQSALLPGHACEEFSAILYTLDFSQAIPNLPDVSSKLIAATGWQLVGVPGLLPDDVFFEHLAHRRFPVTVWLRTPEERDYIVEPDIFHDFFGHVPLLFNPVFADYLQAYGRGGLKAKALNAIDYLARLYWYTVEFGLIQTPQGLRTYGAGNLSSAGELRYCIENPQAHRLDFDLKRVMRTRYKIDSYQETYFVIHSYQELFDATAPDFSLIYQQLVNMPELAADLILESDNLFSSPYSSPSTPGNSTSV